MFGIPGKSPITLTPSAVRQIRKLMERDGRYGLKIGIKKGG
ncbi:MAG: iron-sulfur cluster assembly accessory protein, partial [Rhodobacteraceae bacterium]|nr:iron-sulfur cluster assembly accessory protein [Paracoccaceae bacterium]